MQLSINLTNEEREWIEVRFLRLHERFDTMQAELDRLTAQVQATNGVMASAVVLINGLAGQLAMLQDELNQQDVHSKRLDDLKASLDMGDDALAALLATNAPAPSPMPTPAPTEAPVPVPEPVETPVEPPAPTEPPAPSPENVGEGPGPV